MVFARSTVLSIPYGRTTSSPCSPTRADSRGLPSIVSTSVSETYAVSTARGSPLSSASSSALPEMREPFVCAADVGEVPTEVLQRPAAPLRARRPRGRARAPARTSRATRRSATPASTRARARRAPRARSAEGGSCRHQLDHALEGGERSVGPSALVEVVAEAVVEAARRAAGRSRGPARSLAVRARPRAARGPFGWRARPPTSRARRGRARRARARRARPPTARALARDGRAPPPSRRPPRLARRFDRSGERLSAAARGRPVRGELRRGRGAAARELVREPRVQLLALAGQDRRVDRLREERVAESEAVRRLLGDEDAVLDCLAQRLAHVGSGSAATAARSRVPDVASDGRRHVQQALRASVEPGHALQQQIAQATRKLGVLVAGGRKELFAKKGLPSERATMASVSAAGRGAPAFAASIAVSSSFVERPELEHERRCPTPDAVRHPAHPLRRARPRPRDRSRAPAPVGRRGCARGRREGRARRCRPSAGPRARGAPVWKLLGR